MSLTEIEVRDLIRGKVKSKLRSAKFDDEIVSLLTDDEINDAIYETLDEINSYAPQTNFNLETIGNQSDTRWKSLIVLGATKNSLVTLESEWVDKGIEATIDEFNLSNRKDDFSSFQDKLNDQFQNRLEKLKSASQKFSKVLQYSTSPNKSSSRLSAYNYSRTGW